jgi:hypothetical protein
MYRVVTARLHDPGLLDTPTRVRAWHDSCVLVLPIVLIVAAVAILGGVIVVAMGRGGELAPSSADVRPLDTDIVTAADVALLRPPAALWGYDMRATDEALNQVARTVTERDVEIADLRRQLADMQSAPDDAGQERNPRHAAAPTNTAGQEVPDQDPGEGAPDPGPRPPALPFRRAVGGPTRPPAGEQSWTAWQRPREGTGDEPGDYPETGTATRGRG